MHDTMGSMGKSELLQHNKYVVIAGALGVVAIVVALAIIGAPRESIEMLSSAHSSGKGVGRDGVRGDGFLSHGLNTDTARTDIDLTKVLPGGPGKDGIPSIDNPRFDSLSDLDHEIPDDMRGIVLRHDGMTRYYPYHILVWHEIVNDQIGDIPIAITFCPLCGSAIAYDRRIGNEVMEFGVSGLLYESNLLMYDRNTDSLWSQIEGRAVVGYYVGANLRNIDVDVMSFAQARQQYPEMRVLARPIDSLRDYSKYPYGDYDNNETLLFDVTYRDERLPLKEIVYAVRSDDIPIAFVLASLRDSGQALISLENGHELTASYQNGQVSVTDSEGTVYPGFFAQWFSWANHNLPDGVNPEARGVVWGIQQYNHS